MVRLVRNLSAAIFFTTLFALPTSASTACPPELQGECADCGKTAWGYHYSGCPEGCGFNQDLCWEWCGGVDDCYENQPFPGETCGTCLCGAFSGRPDVSGSC